MIDIDTSEAERVRLVGREMLYKGFVRLEKLTFEQRMSDGSLVTIHREIHDHGSAAAILLHNPGDDTVVLVRQFRPAAFVNGDPGFMLELPAGLVDEGENPAEAVIREAMEETGFQIDLAHHICEMYPSPGAVTEKLSLFAASIDATKKVGDGGGLAGEGEDIEIVTLGLDDAYHMIGSGEITDAKTVVALQWAMINRAKLSSGNLG
ncbi:nudix-type nucleoside diphosphatase (YffH/AdpP family) [Neorhizobium huautlense]|uniref:ADP-ribose pyrophosphatase n=1 Tax=Neorhizobium huautlense TaxID=67774 RepID=A0ABT9PZE1_9HYPH|nr:NUDIX domain-containing protein [Neorhizobium huautlense]MDP9839079.1 nudix-type nucleoside diphosphatase (YffH/AdpP family) [Neorhizobium huautlense]